MPTGFLPDEDQGQIFGQVSAPAGATAEQTAAIGQQVVDYLLTAEKNCVDSVTAVTGFNFAGQAQSAGFLSVKLKDWDARPKAAQSPGAVAARAMNLRLALR